jgi:hypothetical protein
MGIFSHSRDKFDLPVGIRICPLAGHVDIGSTSSRGETNDSYEPSNSTERQRFVVSFRKRHHRHSQGFRAVAQNISGSAAPLNDLQVYIRTERAVRFTML